MTFQMFFQIGTHFPLAKIITLLMFMDFIIYSLVMVSKEFHFSMVNTFLQTRHAIPIVEDVLIMFTQINSSIFKYLV